MLKTVFLLSACSVLFLSQSALAQVGEKEWDNARLQSEVEALKSSVGALSKNVDALSKQLEIIQSNTERATELSMRLNSELQKYATKDDFEALATAVNDQGVRQQNILNAISADDQDGNRYLRLDAILDKSEKGREEFRSALERSVRKTGTLIIVNKIGADRDVIVNGEQLRVLAGATLKLTVPTGTVSTRLPNGEDFTWTIGPANQYSQSIDLIERQTVYRPVSGSASAAVNVSPAPYYDSTPYYYSTPYYSYYNPWGWGGYTYYAY